jgi:hypothetical protein
MDTAQASMLLNCAVAMTIAAHDACQPLMQCANTQCTKTLYLSSESVNSPEEVTARPARVLERARGVCGRPSQAVGDRGDDVAHLLRHHCAGAELHHPRAVLANHDKGSLARQLVQPGDGISRGDVVQDVLEEGGDGADLAARVR